MDALLTAIMTKTVGSALATAVGSRIYVDEAPQGTAYPNVVFFIVSDIPDPVYSKGGEDILIQFSLRSTSRGLTEITGLYNNLRTLFDDCALTITGDTHIWMKRETLATSMEDITTTSGTVGCKHWAVDYRILTQET